MTQKTKPTPRPKQTDLAKHAGVAPSTVSKVINGSAAISAEIRRRVMQSAREIGFHIPELAQSDMGHAYKVKLVTYYQYLTRHSSYFHSEILCSVLEECEKNGVEIETILLSRDHPNDMDEYRAKINASEADAVLFVGTDANELLEVVREKGWPALIVNGQDIQGRFDCVSPGMREGSRLTTRYLLSLGHTEIVHVTHLYRKIIHQRLAGFREALEDAGIEFSMERHVLDLPGIRFSAEEACEVISEKIMQNKIRATAFFCVSDYTALGVIQGIQRSGRSVPDDYSVASFDDLPLAQLTSPSITSAGVDRTELGRLAISQLLNRLRAPSSPTLRIEVGASLSIRNSTKALVL